MAGQAGLQIGQLHSWKGTIYQNIFKYEYVTKKKLKLCQNTTVQPIK